MRRTGPLVLVVMGLAACRPVNISVNLYPSTPTPTPPVVRVFTQFSPGDTLDLVQTQLSLDHYEVRYRSGMPPDEMGMVYFLEDGNLHVDVKKLGATWVLISVPLLEPSTVPPVDRVAEWDRGSDAQVIKSRSDR